MKAGEQAGEESPSRIKPVERYERATFRADRWALPRLLENADDRRYRNENNI